MGEIELSLTAKDYQSMQGSDDGDADSIKSRHMQGPGDKILLVDDQTFNIEALKINLKLKGIEEFFEIKDSEDDGDAVSFTSNSKNGLIRKADTRDNMRQVNLLEDSSSKLINRIQSDYYYQPTFKKDNEDFSNRRIDTAMTGHEALNLVKKLWEEQGKLYRVIFMDCEMPVMNGYQCTQ